jgi:hypothetical protein
MQTGAPPSFGRLNGEVTEDRHDLSGVNKHLNLLSLVALIGEVKQCSRLLLGLGVYDVPPSAGCRVHRLVCRRGHRVF